MSVIFPQYSTRSLLAPVWRSLFGGVLNTVLTLIAVLLLALVLPPLLHWALRDAVLAGTQEECRAAAGACWAFLRAKARFILFAFYPTEELWRPAFVILLLLGLMVISALPRFWGGRLILAWSVSLVAAWGLMAGGGWLSPLLPRVSLNDWGGLPVTLLAWSGCLAFAFPAAVLLALARQSRMTGLRLLSVIWIEGMRAVPMVAVLYFAMLILPMALPSGVILDKLTRAVIMVALFWTAYLAEVVRGGL